MEADGSHKEQLTIPSKSTKNITQPRWFYEAEMTIDLPYNSFSQMKLVEQHDYDLIYSIHAIWHKMPEYKLQVSFNKSTKQQEAMHYSNWRCY